MVTPEAIWTLGCPRVGGMDEMDRAKTRPSSREVEYSPMSHRDSEGAVWANGYASGMGGVLLCIARAGGRIAMEALRYCSTACGGSARAGTYAVEFIVQDDRGHFWARTAGSAWKRRATKGKE